MDVGGDFTNAGGRVGFDTEASAGESIRTRDSLDRFLSPRISASCGTPARSPAPTRAPRSSTKPAAATRRSGARSVQHGALASVRALVGRVLRARGAGRRLRGDAATVRGDDRPGARPRQPEHRPHLLAAEQGVAVGAVAALRLRPRPGGRLLRREEGERAVHILYAYSDGSIRVSNLTNARQTGLRASVGRVPLRSTGACASCDAQRCRGWRARASRPSPRPGLPAGMSQTYFLELELTRGGCDGQPQRLLALAQTRRGRLEGDPRAGHRPPWRPEATPI